jgi:glycosyltransferase involved in cell wall biosynthesis
MLTVDMPLVSIVIPAYNHGKYLQEAIESVLSQDYPRIELIVLDDGSTDNTRQVLEEFGSRFYWETHGNMGQAATLAKGWGIAKGEILAYLSADDRYEDFAVSASVEVLQNHPEAVATYCNFNLIDPSSRIIRTAILPAFDYCKMFVEVLCPVGPGAFFRRTAYELVGPWDPTFRQMPDYDFWLRLGLVGTFIRIPRVLAGFRVHEDSQTYSVTSVERAMEPVIIVNRLLSNESLSKHHVQLGNAALANAELVSAQLHFRSGRYRIGTDSLLRALRLNWASVCTFQTLHRIANSVVNRFGHKLLWTVRTKIFRSR